LLKKIQVSKKLTQLDTKNTSAAKYENPLPTEPQPDDFQPEDQYTITQTEQRFYGPIPHPSTLEGYERIVPGAADRILSMAEADTRHIHAMELKAIAIKGREINKGQNFGLVIGLAGLGASIYALNVGAHAAAASLGGVTLVGLVSSFILGRLPPRKEK